MDTQVAKPLRTGITIILKNELVESDYRLLPGAHKPGLRHLWTLRKSVVPHGGGAEYNNMWCPRVTDWVSECADQLMPCRASEENTRPRPIHWRGWRSQLFPGKGSLQKLNNIHTLTALLHCYKFFYSMSSHSDVKQTPLNAFVSIKPKTHCGYLVNFE